MLRNTFDWDCGKETNFWEIICDVQHEIEDYPSKTRNQIRRCLKDCDIRRISNNQLIDDDGYTVYESSFRRYKNIASKPQEREKWEAGIKKDNKSEFWGVYHKESNKLIAWAANSLIGSSVNYNTLKAIPEYMNKHYPYFGLLYSMNKEYLNARGLEYVTDGFRSVTEHSNIQPFLEKNFLFRKAYCKVKLFYSPWMAIIIKILFPLRSIIPNLNVKNLLKFEEIAKNKVSVR